MLNKKTLAVLNTLAILGMIVVNGLVSSRGINGNTVGSISDRYDTLFTPAGYAFSIWGLIYLLWTGFLVFQWIRVLKKEGDTGFLEQIGPWLLVNGVANIIWIFAWLNASIGYSLLMMLVILVSLIILIIRLDLARGKTSPEVAAFVWLPVCIYSGWIAVASIANVSAFLVSTGWSWLFTAETWTVIMLVVATGLNLLMVRGRRMRGFALVGIWALVAIAYRQWSVIPMIQWTAFAGAVILLLAVLIPSRPARSLT